MDADILLDNLKDHYLAPCVVFGLLTLFELINPREQHSPGSRLIGVGFWAISLGLSFAVGIMLAVAWEGLGVRPLFTVPTVQAAIGGPVIGAILGGVIGALVHDFFFYWYHRIQHRWLWRWHAVHHSIERLNAVNSYHHVSEVMTSLILLQIPMSLMVGMSGPISPIVNLVLWCHVVWIHSPTRVTLGPLRALLVDNRFHRIHHSLEAHHFDKNFGAFTTVWDRLFGTCHMPERTEWPDVGLADIRQPHGFGDWITIPWRREVRAPGNVGDGAPDSGQRVPGTAEELRGQYT